jgi:AbrB family looped-hinge helix DNA binding protein
MANGRIYWQWEAAMRTRVDRFGRIVVPKDVRDRHGIVPGSEVEIEDTAEAIVLRPLTELPGLVEKEGILVFRGHPTGDLEAGLRLHREQRSNRVRREHS